MVDDRFGRMHDSDAFSYGGSVQRHRRHNIKDPRNCGRRVSGDYVFREGEGVADDYRGQPYAAHPYL